MLTLRIPPNAEYSGEVYIIGIKMSSMAFQYSGVLEIPDLQSKPSLTDLINDNPLLSTLSPDCM